MPARFALAATGPGGSARSAARRRLLAAAAGALAAPGVAIAGEPPLSFGPLKLEVPFAPTNFTLIDTMLRVANVTPRDYVIDLGSGDGRINIAAARDWGAAGIGYELDPALVQESRELARVAGVADRVRFSERDLFEADLSAATVVTLYLGKRVNLRVRPKLLAELKPGTRVVSHDFDLGDWKPDLHLRLRDYGSQVFFWWIPARVSGRWALDLDLPGGGRRGHEIDFTQQFQELDAQVRSPGARVGLRDLRLAGERLTFIMMEEVAGAFAFRRFFGRVVDAGAAIEGWVRHENPGRPTEAPFRMSRVTSVEPGPAGAWAFPSRG